MLNKNEIRNKLVVDVLLLLLFIVGIKTATAKRAPRTQALTAAMAIRRLFLDQNLYNIKSFESFSMRLINKMFTIVLI